MAQGLYRRLVREWPRIVIVSISLHSLCSALHTIYSVQVSFKDRRRSTQSQKMQIAQQMEADALLGQSILTILDTSLLLLAMSVRSFSLTRLVFRIWCLKTLFQILSYLSTALISFSSSIAAASIRIDADTMDDDDDHDIFGRSRSFGRSNPVSSPSSPSLAAAAAAAATTTASAIPDFAASGAEWTYLSNLQGQIWKEGFLALVPWFRMEMLLIPLQGIALLVLLRDVKGYSRSSVLFLTFCCCWSWSWSDPEEVYQLKRAKWKLAD